MQVANMGAAVAKQRVAAEIHAWSLQDDETADAATEDDDERKPAAARRESSHDDARLLPGPRQQQPTAAVAAALDVIDLTTAHSEDDCSSLPSSTDMSTTVAYANLPSRVNHKENRKRKVATVVPSVYDDAYDAITMNPLLQNDDDDYALALTLQAAEEQDAVRPQARLQHEDRRMYESTSGQAWKLVEKVVALYHQHFGGVHSQQQPFLSVIAIDDMVYTAERFLTALHAFHRDATASSSSAVDLLNPNDVQWDLGYHYTTHENLARIRTVGLLSKTERASHDIHEVKFNGSAFGDGIYAASNPYAFRNQRYGNVGVLVVRLHGRRQRVWQRHRRGRQRHRQAGTGSMNSTYTISPEVKEDEDEVKFDSTVVHPGSDNEFVVLPTAGQCLPICTFSGPDLTDSNNLQQLNTYTQALRIMLEQFWHDILGGTHLPAKPPSSEASAKGPAALSSNKQSLNTYPLVGNPLNGAGLSQLPPLLTSPSTWSLTPIFGVAASAANPAQQQQQGQPGSATLPSVANHAQQQQQGQPESATLPDLPFTFNQYQQRFSSTAETAQPRCPAAATATPQKPTVVSGHQPKATTDAGGSATGSPLQTTATSNQETDVVSPTLPVHKTVSFSPGLSGTVSSTASASPPQIPFQLATSQIAASATSRMEMASAMQSLLGPGGCDRKPPPPTVIMYDAPTCASLEEADLDEMTTILRHGTFSTISQECAICLDPLMRNENGAIVRLTECKHLFHRKCLLNSLGTRRSASRQCPTCRLHLAPPRGAMPSGTMTVTEDASRDCAGYAGDGSFVLHYNFPRGQFQQAYHPSPGRAIPRTSRTAYVPCTTAGRHLLQRLKYAFTRGLTFTIGTSCTTGRPDQITWGAIPHKSKDACGGLFDSPDASYIDSCNTVLDSLGVPGSDLCP